MRSNIITIKGESGDSEEFIKSINKIMTGLIDKFQINEICIIKIKNWFDHKWLNYSGKSVVQFHGGGLVNDSALKNEWREKITVPPFNPNRVLSETVYRVQPIDNKRFEKPLHKQKTATTIFTTEFLSIQRMDYLFGIPRTQN